jgi:hypothetical protein
MDRGHEAPMDVDDPSRRSPFVELWEEPLKSKPTTHRQKPAVLTKEVLLPPQIKPAKLERNIDSSIHDSPTSWINLASTLYKWTRISIYWLHHIMQLLLISFAIYFISTFALSFRRDLYSKASMTKETLSIKQRDCHRSFLENHCLPADKRPPALALKCEEWRECYERDLEKGFSWSRIFTSTMAEIVEGFLEQVSWRSMVFFVALVAVYLLTSQPKQPTIRIVQDYTNHHEQFGRGHLQPHIENKNPFLLLTEK